MQVFLHLESSFCEEILRVIMNDSGLIVLKSHAQWVGQNLQGRSVILDAKCQLSNGKVVNISYSFPNLMYLIPVIRCII